MEFVLSVGVALAPLAILSLLFAVVVLISSASRRTSPRAGFIALAWVIPISVAASIVSAFASATTSSGVYLLVGAVVTGIVAGRGGYRWGASGLWLLFGPLGWFILLWARNNQLDGRRRESGEAPSPETTFDPSVAKLSK